MTQVIVLTFRIFVSDHCLFVLLNPTHSFSASTWTAEQLLAMYVRANHRYSMLQLKIFYGLIFTLLPQCCVFVLVRFRHQKHMVMVWKSSCFFLKYSFYSPQIQLEMARQTSHEKCKFFVATDRAGNCPEVFLKSSGFTLTNYEMQLQTAVTGLIGFWPGCNSS